MQRPDEPLRGCCGAPSVGPSPVTERVHLVARVRSSRVHEAMLNELVQGPRAGGLPRPLAGSSTGWQRP